MEELVRKVVDLVDNRVENNLRAIANTMLVELPSDQSFTYEKFVTTQAVFQRKQAEQLSIRNEEVKRSIDDLLQLVRTYPRENADVVLDEKEAQLFVRHFSKLMYNAITTCTLKSLQVGLGRLVWGTGGGGGQRHAAVGLMVLLRARPPCRGCMQPPQACSGCAILR